MLRQRTCLLVSGVVFLGACGGNGTSPEDGLTDGLTAEDAQFVAERIDLTTSGVLDDFFDNSGGDPTTAPALTHEPVVWTRTFERSRPCHDGGTLTIGGTSTSTWDAQAVTYDVVVPAPDGSPSGTATRAACAYTREDGVVITLTGEGTWTHERHYLDYAPTGTWITTFAGSYAWERSTGEEGDCTYDLTRTVDTAANTRRLTGTSCDGTVVDRTDAWRG